MAPTVFDISHLLGLIPYVPLFDISATSSISFPFPDLILENSFYTRFLTTEMRKTGDVSNREFFSYLLYTLCRYVLCHGSKKVMSEMIPLAQRFYEGKPFDFASNFLGHVYKVGQSAKENLFRISLLGDQFGSSNYGFWLIFQNFQLPTLNMFAFMVTNLSTLSQNPFFG